MSTVPPLRPRPLVAIVGRPNVGKSTLFNRFVRRRRAIVEPTAGVTRDRLVLPASYEDPPLAFDVMDTGGLGLVDRSDLAESVQSQVLTGVARADLLLFLLDAREGLTLLDQQVAGLLRRAGKPIVLVANKCETAAAQRNLPEFARLGFGAPIPLSAQEGAGLGELYERLSQHLPPAGEVAPLPADAPRIAVLGRRNAGKSSYVNALLGEQRVIVSPIPGTTRDAVEVRFAWRGRPAVLVDTAGIHRRTRVANAVEFFSLGRTEEALQHADVALLLLDLTDQAARLDQGLARAILDHHKPVVVLGTKADLVSDAQRRAFADAVAGQLPHLRGAPVYTLSNLTGKGVGKPLDAAFALRAEAQRRVSTAELNKALRHAFDHLRFRGRGDKPRAYYATQLATAPPTFLLFVNRKRAFEKEALRTLAQHLRERLGFPRVPIRLVLRERARAGD